MAVRLNINVNDETAKALRELADDRDTTVTEIVRRAVAIYKFVDEETRANRKTLQLVDPANEEVTTVAMLS